MRAFFNLKARCRSTPASPFRHLRIALLSVALAGAGCTTLDSTKVYYLPRTVETFSPKPKDFPIPILEEPPKRPHEVIGVFEWETFQSWRFVRKALEYNARQAGADAVVLKKKNVLQETVLTDIPPRFERVPYVTYVTVLDGGNSWKCRSPNTRLVPIVNTYPVFRPGYVDAQIVSWLAVRAEMIRFQ